MRDNSNVIAKVHCVAGRGQSLVKTMDMEEVELRLPGCTLESLFNVQIMLPSTPAWRNDNYYRLVEMHRNKDKQFMASVSSRNTQ